MPRINLVVVGHKDHGKSTLIGRLLYDSGAIQKQKLDEIQTELKKSGKAKFEFAFLLDSLEEERKGGLTIDIMQTPFKSKKYLYTIIDCPGHKEFIKKMLSGASQADAAVLVVSAKEGIEDQTRHHAFLIKILGIKQLVVAVNKIDAVAYREDLHRGICRELGQILDDLGYYDVPMVPVSAMKGDNIFKKSRARMKWYNGLALIDTLDENMIPRTLPLNKPLRGVVQDVYRSGNNEQIIVCKIQTGTLKPKKTVIFNPSGTKGLVKKILTFGSKAQKAEPGDSVGLILNGIETIERGEVLSYPQNQPPNAKKFTAEMILFSDVQIKNDQELMIRCGTAEKRCKVEKILNEMDPVNLTVDRKLPEVLRSETVGEVEFLALEPLYLEKYSDFPELGRFVVEGRKGTVAAGIVLELQS